MNTYSKSDFIYTSCYCEENVYKLCELLNEKFSIPLSRIYAVFISNENKQVKISKFILNFNKWIQIFKNGFSYFCDY